MPFMQRQITVKQNWIEVETSQGITFLPAGELGLHVRNSETEVQPLTPSEIEKYKKLLWTYCEGEPQEWRNVMGHGARLSAPGYLDCTEWCVFDTVEEATAYLDEYYPEDEESEAS